MFIDKDIFCFRSINCSYKFLCGDTPNYPRQDVVLPVRRSQPPQQHRLQPRSIPQTLLGSTCPHRGRSQWIAPSFAGKFPPIARAKPPQTQGGPGLFPPSLQPRTPSGEAKQVSTKPLTP
ncbi:hypothetical protein RvY_19096-2 [Ramazzottius varieornatus]|uniref:Uncharacterized protein n=1 Tax=Ramazzottius varieornatus TaxID=947166 RepID=A0A1D1WC23_RAMVA|nr:hypothetical protein RvY_19096-2 [Ramazzottius varieornatus]